MKKNKRRRKSHKNSDVQKAAISIGVGTAVGAGTSALVGNMGLAVGGTAVAVTMAPVAAAGAIAGMAGYGIYKLFGKK